MNPLTGQELEEYVIQLRRDFHRNPELGGEERRTSQIVQQELEKLGITYETGYGGYGIMGVIEGEGEGPIVALRADMDALPIKEQADVAYASTIEGKMHACGHDAHTAMLIGTAHHVMKKKAELNGKVLLIFQPSEEVSPIGGAKLMIEDGIFDKYKPDVIYAQHVWPKLPVGKFGVKPGFIMGASDKFELTIKGKGGHASMPHQGKDAILAVTKVISTLQTIVSRNVDPLKEVVVTIGLLKAGYRYNVIADEAYLEGTIRTFDSKVRKQVEERLRDIIEYTCKAMETTSELTVYSGYSSTCNDEVEAKYVKQMITDIYGEASCPDILPSLGSEDFSRFLEDYKGVYYWLGVGGATGDYPSLHDPYFQIDERALKIGYTMMGNITLSYAKKHSYT
ncbi:M20 family metallopeptidase [Peribacillus sp. SIMBA_075]|uniref:M20 metallopeptidase family protein n=1 Tax=Peribacillus sp. SIMBA_075 TaxID=3085813 RepID=UPI0039794A65